MGETRNLSQKGACFRKLEIGNTGQIEGKKKQTSKAK